MFQRRNDSKRLPRLPKRGWLLAKNCYAKGSELRGSIRSCGDDRRVDCKSPKISAICSIFLSYLILSSTTICSAFSTRCQQNFWRKISASRKFPAIKVYTMGAAYKPGLSNTPPSHCLPLELAAVSKAMPTSKVSPEISSRTVEIRKVS